jgi:hypothetical protein
MQPLKAERSSEVGPGVLGIAFDHFRKVHDRLLVLLDHLVGLRPLVNVADLARDQVNTLQWPVESTWDNG